MRDSRTATAFYLIKGETMKDYLDYIENLLKKLEKGEVLSSKEEANLTIIMTSSFLVIKMCNVLMARNQILTQFSITTTN